MKNKILPLALGLFCLTLEARPNRLSIQEIAEKVGCQDQFRPEVCQRIVKRHLVRDLMGCQVDPDLVKDAPQMIRTELNQPLKVRGRNAFLGMFPLPYRYTGRLLSAEGAGEIEIRASVYFTNDSKLSPGDFEKMQKKLDQAAEKWTQYNPYPFKVRFKFEITHKRRNASVKAKLLLGKQTRGPYFSFWTDQWSSSTIAHEMGHVMGLDDEYSNTPFRSLNYCDGDSIMCTNARPKPYHYYLIIRRLLCK